MTTPGTPAVTNDVFDVRRIRRLVELMHENDLAEIDLQQSDLRIQLRRNVAAPIQAPQQPVIAHYPVPQSNPLPSPAAHLPAQAAAPDDSHCIFVKSPMVGTFYSAAKPDAPPFVKVGDTVQPDTTVCILEAMKVFNEIQAEVSGKIVAVLATNGQAIEFGKPLFKVDPRG